MKNSSHQADQLRVLVCDPIHADAIALMREQLHVDVIDGDPLDEGTLVERIGTYHATINRSRTPIPASVIRQGKHLRIIVRAGAGLDNIDVATATEMEIPVESCGGSNASAVAEHTLGLMLNMARHITTANATMKDGLWEKSQFMGEELGGKTLGIIGFGNIGREVARRAVAFDMNVLVNQRRPTPELTSEWRVENVDLIKLLEESDYVTLHIPLRPETRGLIGEKELAHMKPSAYLINTSRGGIVDEAALLNALNDGELRGAALDVFENEPTISQKLVQHPKLIATPHIGASTLDAQRAVGLMAAQKVLDALQRKSPAEALSLRLVPTDQVIPHEKYHGPRVERLAQALEADGMLANPPLVAEIPEQGRYVVLDGATRTTAFKKQGYPHIIVQNVDVDHHVQLFSWSHVLLDVYSRGGFDALYADLMDLPGIALSPCPLNQVQEAIHVDGALCTIINAKGEGLLVRVEQSSHPSSVDWLDLINAVVGCLGDWGDIERTLTQNVEQLKSMYGEFTALVSYPTFTPDFVLQTAGQDRLLPAGITRFVIPGRILRLNASLDMLRSDVPQSIKQDWLDDLVKEKLAKRQVRYYQEPIMLLDE